MPLYVLDTNIFILAGRSLDFQAYLQEKFNLFDPETRKIASIVTRGELATNTPEHLVGPKRLKRQAALLKAVTVVEINNKIANNYGSIELYSLGKHPARVSPRSAIIMGQNDLWIAATTLFFSAELITTDHDFAHLDPEFFPVHYIAQSEVFGPS